MEVRQALENDLEAVARVQARTMVWCGFYEDSVDEDREYERLLPRVVGYFHGTYHPSHAREARSILVAVDGGQIIGFIAGHESTRMGCEAELQWMFVLPERQHRGVGTRLLQPMAKWFAERKKTHVIVDAPPENPFRAFYVKFGAEPLDEYWLHWRDIESAVGRTESG